MTTRRSARPTTIHHLLDNLFAATVEQRDGGIDVTATTSVEQFLRANPSRVAFTFINLGSNAVFIWTDQSVSATRGIRVAPNGGSSMLIYDEDFTRVAFPWYMISSGGNSDVAIMEVLLSGGGE